MEVYFTVENFSIASEETTSENKLKEVNGERRNFWNGNGKKRIDLVNGGKPWAAKGEGGKGIGERRI